MEPIIKDFEDYLQYVHSLDYHGTDDDMPDAYEDWLGALDADDFIRLANEAIILTRAAGTVQASA